MVEVVDDVVVDTSVVEVSCVVVTGDRRVFSTSTSTWLAIEDGAASSEGDEQDAIVRTVTASTARGLISRL